MDITCAYSSDRLPICSRGTNESMSIVWVHVAVTPTVKAVQTRNGSRHAYGHVEERGAWQSYITPELAGPIAAQTSIFFATLSRSKPEGKMLEGVALYHRATPNGHNIIFLEEAGLPYRIVPLNSSVDEQFRVFQDNAEQSHWPSLLEKMSRRLRVNSKQTACDGPRSLR